MTTDEIIRAFNALYVGDLAKQRRAAGEPHAMPPWAETYWLGKQVAKCPMDLWVYQEILWETRPDLLIETGTSGAGSAFFFASIFDRIGKGHVVTVDTVTYPHLCHPHPRITYLVGDSVSPGIVSIIKDYGFVYGDGGRVMVSLDSLHTYPHVAAELAAYADLVTPGCYCVIEDVHYPPGEPGDPAWGSRAAYEFELKHPEFRRDRDRERHLMTANVWLRRT